MDNMTHNLGELFMQLGLPAGDSDIREFILRHRGIPVGTPLAEADFWNESQAAFLREEREQDADWAELIDQLDTMLRD